MSKIQGHCGMTLLGDQSFEFHRDVVQFVEKRRKKYETDIFLTRILNKPTIIVTSHSQICRLLTDYGQFMEMGYSSFMQSVYDENLLCLEGEMFMFVRGLMQSAMKEIESSEVERICHNVLLRTVTGGDHKVDCIYDFFKGIFTQVCLSLFLGVDAEENKELSETIVQLSTKQWHGIISVPVNLPSLISQSTYTKAVQAKKKLLPILQVLLDGKRDGGPKDFLCAFGGLEFPVDGQRERHLLLFTSALLPKALASVTTSLVLALHNEPSITSLCQRSPECLRHALLEVERLWPPFFGGRRLIRRRFEFDGHTFPDGHSVFYVIQAAHHDPTVFPRPLVFRPDRWRHLSADLLLTFGHGRRTCLGRQVVQDMIESVAQFLLTRCRWQVQVPAQITYKHLPVLRPVQPIAATFTLLSPQESARVTESEKGTERDSKSQQE